MEQKKRPEKILLLAFKVAVGSSAAIYIAELLHLEYAAAAGTIALLTLMTTKWETVRLSAYRVITFLFTAALACLVFPYVHSIWLGFGIVIFIVVLVSEFFGMRATISINAVIAAHFMTKQDFSMSFVRNEFLLVLTGIIIAFLLNLFHLYNHQKKSIIAAMRCAEKTLQSILRQLAAYLVDGEMQGDVWEDICNLDKKLQEFVREAYEYQENTFHSHPGYYIDYFEMRSDQCHMLDSLHAEMTRLKATPKQAALVADYIRYVADHIEEKNVPDAQMEKLQQLLREMETDELPKDRAEFESRALLFHILMDLEEFLKFKLHFVGNLTERQRKEYWG